MSSVEYTFPFDAQKCSLNRPPQPNTQPTPPKPMCGFWTMDRILHHIETKNSRTRRHECVGGGKTILSTAISWSWLIAANSFQKGRFIKNDEIDIGEEGKKEQAPIWRINVIESELEKSGKHQDGNWKSEREAIFIVVKWIFAFCLSLLLGYIQLNNTLWASNYHYHHLLYSQCLLLFQLAFMNKAGLMAQELQVVKIKCTWCSVA